MTNVGEKEAGLGRRDGALESRRCGALRRRVARFATAMGRSVAEALRPLMERSPAWGGRRGVRTAGTGMGGDALPQEGPVPVAALPARVPEGADPGGSGATAKRWLRRRFGGGRRSARGGLALDAGLWAALRRGADGLPMATPGNGTAGAFGQGIQGDYASGHRRGVRRAGTGVGGGALPRGPVHSTPTRSSSPWDRSHASNARYPSPVVGNDSVPSSAPSTLTTATVCWSWWVSTPPTTPLPSTCALAMPASCSHVGMQRWNRPRPTLDKAAMGRARARQALIRSRCRSRSAFYPAPPSGRQIVKRTLRSAKCWVRPPRGTGVSFKLAAK